MADELYLRIADRYPNRNVVINVSEDNENGCEIHYNLTKPYQQLAI